MDVSEYWAKLKASTATQAVLAKNQKPYASYGIAANRGHDAARDQHTCPSKHLATCHPAPQLEHADCAPIAISCLNEAGLKQTASRLLEGLKGDAPAHRLRACKGLQQLMQQAAPTTSNQQQPAPHDVLLEGAAELLGGSVGKGLLRRLADSSQAVREAAAQALLTGLQVAPGSVLALLPYAIPVLGERLTWQQGTNKVAEESCEEVRLLCCQLTARLVALADKALTAYGSEVVEFMQFMLADSYYEINMVGCSTIVDLNAALGLRLASVSKALVAAILPLTTHPRHRVRCAAVKALRVTMHQNAHEMILEMIAWRDPNVVPVAAFYGDDLKVNFAGKLATDPHPMVRLEWVATLRDWLLNLRERVDHKPRLLPYLLSALTDSVSSVSSAAVDALHALGAAYEVEHAKELAELTAYLPSTAQSLGWLDGAAPASQAATGSVASAGSCVPAPPPGIDVGGLCKHAWRLGVVRVVQAQCSRSLYALLAELLAWQEDARRAAAVLLRTGLFFASSAMHQQAQQVLQGLCRAVTDPCVQPVVLDCCALLAAALPPQLLLQLLLPRVAETGTDPVVQAGMVRLLAAVARGACSRLHDLPACLPQLLDVLDGTQGVMLSADTQLRAAASDLLHAVLKAPPALLTDHAIRYPAATTCSLTTTADTLLLQQAAMALGFPTSHAAVHAHLHALLDSCDASTSHHPALATAVLAHLLQEGFHQQNISLTVQPTPDVAACEGSSSEIEHQAATEAAPVAGCSHNLNKVMPRVTAAIRRAMPQLATSTGDAQAVLDALLCSLQSVHCGLGKGAAAATKHQLPSTAAGQHDQQGPGQNVRSKKQQAGLAGPSVFPDNASSMPSEDMCDLMCALLAQIPDGMPRKQVLCCTTASVASGLLLWQDSELQGNQAAKHGPAALVHLICTHGCGSGYAAARLQACSTLQAVCCAWTCQQGGVVGNCGHQEQAAADNHEDACPASLASSQLLSSVKEAMHALLGCLLDAHVAVRLAASAAMRTLTEESVLPMVTCVATGERADVQAWLCTVATQLNDAHNSEEDAAAKDSMAQIAKALQVALAQK